MHVPWLVHHAVTILSVHDVHVVFPFRLLPAVIRLPGGIFKLYNNWRLRWYPLDLDNYIIITSKTSPVTCVCVCHLKRCKPSWFFASVVGQRAQRLEWSCSSNLFNSRGTVHDWQTLPTEGTVSPWWYGLWSTSRNCNFFLKQDVANLENHAAFECSFFAIHPQVFHEFHVFHASLQQYGSFFHALLTLLVSRTFEDGTRSSSESVPDFFLLHFLNCCFARKIHSSDLIPTMILFKCVRVCVCAFVVTCSYLSSIAIEDSMPTYWFTTGYWFGYRYQSWRIVFRGTCPGKVLKVSCNRRSSLRSPNFPNKYGEYMRIRVPEGYSNENIVNTCKYCVNTCE